MKIIRNKKGFTLVEILLVVGFIALASIGIYAVYNKIETSQKAHKTFTQMRLLWAGVENLYGNTTSTWSLNNTVIINAKIAPEDMVDSATNTLVNPFSGSVRATSTAGVGFAFIYQGIPGDACVKIGAAAAAANIYFGVGGDGWVGSTTILSPYVPYDTTRLAVACNQDTGSGVGMNFRSRQ